MLAWFKGQRVRNAHARNPRGRKMQEDVKLCVFNKDCSLLAVAVGGNEVGVWEAETGQLKERITTQGSVARCVAWSKPPQKRRRSRSSHVLLAVGSGSSVSIWNITKGSQERAVVSLCKTNTCRVIHLVLSLFSNRPPSTLM